MWTILVLRWDEHNAKSDEDSTLAYKCTSVTILRNAKYFNGEHSDDCAPAG